MSIIKVMDINLSNKIAAGEVVERLMNIVKELVENAIDAKASEIKIELVESGLKEIKVIDNGCGMDKNDATTCLLRHATSKIYDDDLFNINNVIYTIEDIPDYNGKPYVYINNNIPYFTEEEYTTKVFEKYSNLDYLKRAGTAYSCIGKELMPKEDRTSIGMIKPSGWHTVKYDIVDGKYLYNRCHLIGYQLTGENANEKNLITCTRYMNTSSMLIFENKVSKYIKETSNHVLYRVTPIYKGSNLLATGVLIEAYSVEDNGKGIKFNVFIYNIQEGIEIDYKTGDSKLK